MLLKILYLVNWLKTQKFVRLTKINFNARMAETSKNYVTENNRKMHLI